MNRHAVRLLSSVAFITVIVALSPEATACVCEPRTAPEPRDGSVKKTPDFEFSWLSEADKKSGERYCYERVVKNEHSTKHLDYRWPVAAMSNKALPPKERDRKCKHSGAYRQPPDKGILRYGQTGEENTEVWKSTTEPAIEKTTVAAPSVPG